jgi:hypothetical protein
MRQRDHIWRRASWLAVLCAPIVAAGASFASVGPASAANNGVFSVQPTAPPGTPPTQIRAYFSPQLAPGVQAADSVTVVNLTSKPMVLKLFAADAYTTRVGGFGIRPDYAPKLQMGEWIHLPVSSVAVPAEEGVLIPFSYNPPANASPGDHAGGIVAEETQGATSKHGSVAITVLQAVGARVYGRVAGPLHPDLSVVSTSITTTSSIAGEFGGPVDAKVTYSVENTGNENASPKVKVSLSPLFGSGPKSRTVQLPQVLPGSTVAFSETFKNVLPLGDLSASVTASALGVSTNGSTSTAVIPWGLVAVVIVLIGLIWLYYWRKRRLRRLAAVGPPPAQPAKAASLTG